MRLVTGTRTRILADLTFEFDPSAATVTIEIDDNGTLHDATWVGPAVSVGAEWTRTAQTVEFFVAGPVDDPGTAIELPLGRHYTTAHVTAGADSFLTPSTVLDVVAEPLYVAVDELRDALANAGGAGSRTAAELSDDRLAVKLEEAVGEVVGTLSQFTIDAVSPPALLRTIVIGIASYLATLEFYGSQPLEERDPVVLGYARARDLLLRVSRGQIVVAGIDPANTGRAEGEPEIYQGTPSLGLADSFTPDYGARHNAPAYFGGAVWE